MDVDEDDAMLIDDDDGVVLVPTDQDECVLLEENENDSVPLAKTAKEDAKGSKKASEKEMSSTAVPPDDVSMIQENTKQDIQKAPSTEPTSELMEVETPAKVVNSNSMDESQPISSTSTGASTTPLAADEEAKEEVNEAKSSPSCVIPLDSPRIPSLAYKMSIGTKVWDKEIRPTVAPASKPEPVVGDSVNKLLTYSKSISSALAPKISKRKHQGGCCNLNCTHGSDDLIIAPKHAIIYFHFNMALKKIYKICSYCLADAEAYMRKATKAVQNGDCILTFKTEPQGLDGDVIEVSEADEDDDPVDVQSIEAENNEVLELAANFDEVLNGILSNIDLKLQVEKCEKTVQSDTSVLERDLVTLDSKISLVEKQVIEAKKMYDKITGYNQPLPFVLEELDIDVHGNIKKTRGENPHIDKMPNEKKTLVNEYILSEKFSKPRGIGLPARDDKRNVKGTRTKLDDGEVMEVEDVQNQKPVEKINLAPTPKVIPRVMPKVGSIVYALSRSLLHYWLKGEVIEVINVAPGKAPEFLVKFFPMKGGDKRGGGANPVSKQVTAKQVAYNLACPFVLPVGARILAKFRDELKTEPAGDGQFYAGVVAEPPKNTNNFRYLVFFDDGYAQYVSHEHVLMVYENSKEVWTDVHPDSSDFIKNYVTKYPERPMVRMTVGQVVTTEWNGKWWVARVAELDCSLVKMKFENDGRNEWIYRGSTRLSPLFEKQTRQKTRLVARRQVTNRHAPNQATIEYNYGDDDVKRVNSKPVARKSTGIQQNVDKTYSHLGDRRARVDYGEFEGTIIKRPVPANAPKTKQYVTHKCNSSCVIEYNENDKELRKLTPLSVPLYLGWSRDLTKNPRRHIFYRGPCGKRLRNVEELYNYLTLTNCDITIDHFCFDLAVDCLNEFRHARQHSFLPDLTYGKELTPVQVVNAFDFEYPPYVEYSAARIAGKNVHLNTNDEFLVSCDCEDDCRDKSKCSCWQLTLSGISFTKLNNEETPVEGYSNRRLKDHIVSGVYECNSRCKCRKTCCNKVAQNGLKFPLQVFKTAAKGWGIRPLYDVPEGSFICIYAGQVLTEQGANEDGKQFGDEYLAELDYIESIEGIKAEYESDVTDIEAEDVPPPDKSKKKRGKGSKDEDEEESENEVDSHANDSSYRGKAPTIGRTINTRNKNGRTSSTASSKNDSDEDDEEGTRKRSRFNADVNAVKTKKKVERRPLREYFGEEELCFIMDAKTTGNIGRYLNHSCQPNVFVQNVFVDTHDLRFPWVAFFASKHIRAGSELTWDYNYDIGSVPDKVMYCYCGSPDCRGRLL